MYQVSEIVQFQYENGHLRMHIIAYKSDNMSFESLWH